MPAANSLHGGTQPEVGTTVFSSTGTTQESLRMDCVGHAAQAPVPAGPREPPSHRDAFGCASGKRLDESGVPWARQSETLRHAVLGEIP